MRYRCKGHNSRTSLVRRSEKIFDRAMGVFLAYLLIMMVFVYSIMGGVRMGVQVQQQHIGHHHSHEEQEQQRGDICYKF